MNYCKENWMHVEKIYKLKASVCITDISEGSTNLMGEVTLQWGKVTGIIPSGTQIYLYYKVLMLC